MEIFDQIINEFLTIPHVKEWDDLQVLFRRAASGKPGHWLLPLRTCESVGGSAGRSIPAAVAVACSHIGIVLVDDMLDADPRGEYLRAGAPAVANMASALQSAALAVIARSEMDSDAKLIALESLNEMFLATTMGQYWDVKSIVMDESSYWLNARAKSSPFFGTTLQMGALMGGASVNVAAQIKELGSLYGEMIQVHDDLNDTMAVPANPDWTEGRSPLPILFARIVDHPARARFEEIYPYAGSNPKILEEAQEILIQCGAVSYCVYQLLSRYETAKGILSSLPIERNQILEKIFGDVVQPVFKLFQEMGETFTSVPQVDAA